MKNNERICRVLSSLSGIAAAVSVSIGVLLLMAAARFIVASAGESGSCTLCIQYMDGSVPIAGVEFRAYRVADLLEHGEYALTEPFGESGAVLDSQMTHSEWEEAASKFADCVKTHAPDPCAGGRTGDDGSLTFGGLQEGLYLVEGSALSDKRRILQPQAFCVALPDRDPDGNPNYNVTATPKYEIKQIPEETGSEKESETEKKTGTETEPGKPEKPELVIEKEQSLNGGIRTKNKLTARAFDVITYYLTVKNISAVDATEVIVTDAVPQRLALKQGSDAVSDGGVAADNVIVWNLGTLPAHAIRTVSFKAVTPRVESYTLWKNTASVNYKENDGPPGNSNEVEAEEEPVSDAKLGNVTVTKKLMYNGYPLAAENAVFYVALYADEACTVRVTDPAELRFVASSAESATFKGLELDRTYYVGESDAQGNMVASGMVSDGTVFTAVFGSGSGVKLESTDEPKNVEFENVFRDIPSGYMREGALTITKKVLDADGIPEASDETFYAGIFADAAHTKLSDVVSENIVPLSMSGNSEISVSVNVSCAKDTVLKLYVTEVTEDGTPVGDGFDYEAEVDGRPEFRMDVMENDVTITNRRLEEPDSEGTEEEPGGTAEPGADARSVRTGDDTPIMPYIFLLMASACVAAATVSRRRKDG